MNGSHLSLCELQTRRVALSTRDADYLRLRHAAHVDLRLLPGDPGGWLLTPRQVCGVIPLPSGRALHIEPKVPISTVWHMLGYAWGAVELGPLSPARGVSGLFEGLMASYVRELAALLDRGLARGFVTRREVVPVIRGRLDLAAQLRIPSRPPSRFACVYEALDVDTAANRVLAAALQVARLHCGRDTGLAPVLRRCAGALAGVCAEPPGSLELARACAPADLGHYRVALALARLILEGCATGHQAGGRQVPALIVDMPRLFERFVRGVLARGLSPALRARSTGRAAALDEDGRALLAPDVVIAAGRSARCVVDAKYRSGGPAPADPAADDVYQMLAYCIGYGLPEAVLIYPEPRETPPLVIDLARHAGREVATGHPTWRARIHALGIDLSGDWSSVRAQCADLCARVAAIAGAGEDRRP